MEIFYNSIIQEVYKKFLHAPFPEEHTRKLSLKILEYEKKISYISKLITFCIQKEKKGFGYAIFQSREFCKNEPVLLLLGDTIYRSYTNKTCSVQLIEAYELLDMPIVSCIRYTLNKLLIMVFYLVYGKIKMKQF